MKSKITNGDLRTFGFAKLLSWTSLVLILASGLALSIIMANSARRTLIEKQEQFALLLARNLNYQIYNRFILPTYYLRGYIALKDPEQYRVLKEVILSSTHGLRIQRMSLYDEERVVSYSTEEELVGNASIAPADVDVAFVEGTHSFRIMNSRKWYESLYQFTIKPGAVTMTTIYPLRAEGKLRSPDIDNPVIGVLELVQDISGDYQTVVRYQWLVITSTLITMVVVYLILWAIISKVDKVNALRVAERERLERELNQSEKLASIGRMVAGIAHEIRNPLGIIRSSSELLMKKAEKAQDSNARILGAIYSESKRLSQTVNDFLDYARPKNPKQEPINLSKILDQVFFFLERELATKNITVEKDYPEELKVMGDKDLLYRAFYNIVVNSAQAIEEKGTIKVMSEADQGEVILNFRDSGPGFDEKSLDHLLDPFYTTKDHGTGLGMTIMNNIVESHQGSVILSNAEEGGAVVRVRFPALGQSGRKI